MVERFTLPNLITPPTIPVALSGLFADMDFLAAAPEEHKPCFYSQCYVNDNTWKGWSYRKVTGEGADKGNDKIRKTCEEAAQAIQQYYNSRFYDILLNKAVGMRAGLLKIQRAYKNQIVPYGHIGQSILVLDMHLPDMVKISHGIMADPLDLGSFGGLSSGGLEGAGRGSPSLSLPSSPGGRGPTPPIPIPGSQASGRRGREPSWNVSKKTPSPSTPPPSPKRGGPPSGGSTPILPSALSSLTTQLSSLFLPSGGPPALGAPPSPPEGRSPSQAPLSSAPQPSPPEGRSPSQAPLQSPAQIPPLAACAPSPQVPASEPIAAVSHPSAPHNLKKRK